MHHNYEWSPVSPLRGIVLLCVMTSGTRSFSERESGVAVVTCYHNVHTRHGRYDEYATP